MTKTMEQKEQFIQLRAKGLSFDKIAEELEVSKPTLISWNGEFLEEVAEAQFHELDNLLNEYKVHRRKRFEKNCKLLNAVYEELEKRADKLQKLSVPELAKLAETLEKKIEAETERSSILIEVPSNYTFGRTERIEL
jgi:transposase